MRSLFGLALAGALALGTASDAKAQFMMSIGNPYAGQGFAIGSSPYGYGYGAGLGYGAGYGGFGYSSYSSGYGGLGMYSSGYSGYAPAVFGAVTPVYPAYGYRPYYGGYGYGRGPVYYRPYAVRRFRPW